MLDGGVLAVAPYALLSSAAAATAVLFAIAVGLRVRQRHMLLGTAAMALLALWFAGIAITAGPAPVLKRGDVAEGLRWLALVASLLWLVWLTTYAAAMVKLRRY